MINVFDYIGKHMSENTREKETEGIVFGRNAVSELLKSGRSVDKVIFADGAKTGSASVIEAMAKNAGIPVLRANKAKLDKLACGANHQGVVAMTAGVEYSTVDDILHIAEQRGEKPFILICDNIEDPHNLGALIRCAEGAGVHGVIIPKRHGCGITPTVEKASAGACEHMSIAKVTNIASTIDLLKERGLWIYGAEADGTNLYETSLAGSAAFVVGSEGSGISRLVREKCDFTISIPMYGKINSFNVSCAGAVIMCEAAKQRNN